MARQDASRDTNPMDQAASLEDLGDVHAASTSSLPKLRLTLKVPPQQSAAVTETNDTAKTKLKKPRKAGVGKVAQAAATVLPKSKSKLALAIPAESTIELSQTTTISKPVEKRELPPQFAEQIDILKQLRAFKTRKWSSTVASVKTLSGATLTVPMWTREGKFNHDGILQTGSSSRRNSIDDLAQAAGEESFACSVEGCGKTFDTKEKLKRHQAAHKKKLQLKIPKLKLIQSETLIQESSDIPSDPVESTSRIDSELL